MSQLLHVLNRIDLPQEPIEAIKSRCRGGIPSLICPGQGEPAPAIHVLATARPRPKQSGGVFFRVFSM